MTLLLWAIACTGDELPIECDEETECEFGSICVDGQCVAQTCASSDQCGIEYYCSSSECVPGCELDTDCRFGDLCDTDSNACVAAACGDAHLDCDFGQYCSPNGECYDAGGYHCAECDDHGDCGGSDSDNYCFSGNCAVVCERQVDCPGGYVCSALSDLNGNILGNYCITSCD